MKKRISLLISAMVLLSACGSGQKQNESTPDVKPSETPEIQETADTQNTPYTGTDPVSAVWRNELDKDLDYLPDIYYAEGANAENMIVFRTETPVTDFTVLSLFIKTFDADGVPEYLVTERYHLDELTPEHPFLASLVFNGDLPNNGISYVDHEGKERWFSVELSGKDGSLFLNEMTSDTNDNVSYEMEDYEFVRIALLGQVHEYNSVENVMSRPAQDPMLEPALSIPEERIIYGDQGKRENNIYLIIPNKDIELQVGKYDIASGEITDVLYQGTEPILYVETAEQTDPAGVIIASRGSDHLTIPTGLDVFDGVLRTAFQMGAVDITPYQILDGSEKPVYGMAYYDYLTMREDIQKIVAEGGSLYPMQEASLKGHYYGVFVLEDKDGQRSLYAVREDLDTFKFHVLAADEYGTDWHEID